MNLMISRFPQHNHNYNQERATQHNGLLIVHAMTHHTCRQVVLQVRSERGKSAHLDETNCALNDLTALGLEQSADAIKQAMQRVVGDGVAELVW